MALPQKAIEQLSREPVRTPGWSYHIMMVSGTVFFLSLMVYFGLRFGYKPFFERQLASVEKQIQDFTIQIPAEDQQNLIAFFSQLSNLNNLLKRQQAASKIFDWVERNTHVNVYYTSFSFDITNRRLALSGEATRIEDIAEQLKVFEMLEGEVAETQEIAAIGFGGTASQEGKTPGASSWPFTFNITFTPNFFANAEGESLPSIPPAEEIQ